MMTNFTKSILAQCVRFSPFSDQTVELPPSIFSRTKGTVAEFVAEIQHTCVVIEQEKALDYLAFYTDRLVKQFDSLKRAVDALHRSSQTSYRPTYQFARNVHQLPVEARLREYYKALRMLNEKLSWLMEQNYACIHPEQKQRYLFQIQETEYRKQKCLEAIQALE